MLEGRVGSRPSRLVASSCTNPGAVDDTLTPLDIVNCYRLALGRDPESEEVIEDKLRQPKVGLLPDFFSSSEFQDGVRPKLAAGVLSHPVFRTPPAQAFKDWVAAFAPLTDGGAQAVKEADGWYALHHALFTDPAFTGAVLTREALDQNAAFVAALALRERLDAAGRIRAHIDVVTPHEIRGWMVDTGFPDRRLAVELWIEGAFRAATATQDYRPDIQARHGGQGRVGFILPLPVSAKGAGARPAELREAASGAVVEAFELRASDAARLDEVVALRRELSEVRDLLSRIEARLPGVNEAYSFGLDAYGDYFETYYGGAAEPRTPAQPLPDLAVVVDASQAPPAALDAALASLERQHRTPAQVVVVHPGNAHRLDYAQLLQDWRPRIGADLAGVPVEEGWARAMADAVGSTPALRLVLLQAEARLAPDACGLVADALRRGAALVYADGDRVRLEPDGRAGRHHDPQLRSAFDGELFLQQGDLGEILGVARAALEAAGPRSEPEGAGLYGLLLRLVAACGREAVVHIPRVLAHVAGREPLGPEALDARRAALEAHLHITASGALVEPHHDALGAAAPSAFRIRRPLPAGRRAAIVIPTRDRLDLLAPCLASLAATMEHNRTRMEILVVDNLSKASETHAFLEQFARTHPLRVLSHEGAFNWALINNRAAAETDADVLVFLNNDTVALTPDWCDELCSQALRPEVGAVGARLLYGDGTIQHAGMVTGGWHAFAAHEGMGARGDDAGYMGRHALVREVSAVTGACLATRAEVFRDLGGFDALNLPVEGNDVDYCFRVQGKGLRVLYDPFSTLYHYESKSRGYNTDPETHRQAQAAGALVRARWSAAHQDDPGYNPHFDRLSAPLTRLRPPPPLP